MNSMMKKSLKQQQGQAMVEYVVVVFFSVMLLLAPLYDPDDGAFESFGYANPGGKADYDHVADNLNAIEVVQAVMQDNYRGYSYAMSLSEYPDYLPGEAEANALQAKLDEFADLESQVTDIIDLSGIDADDVPSLADLFPPDIEIDPSSLNPADFLF